MTQAGIYTTLRRLAQLLFGAAAVTLVLTGWRSLRTPDEAVALPAPIAAQTVASVSIPVTDAAISQAVARDLFAPDRSAPATAYRVGKGGEPATASKPVRAAADSVSLLGTVVAADGRSFAMCRVGHGSPRIIYAGQKAGALTLERVLQGSATFTDSTGRRVTLLVPKGGN